MAVAVLAAGGGGGGGEGDAAVIVAAQRYAFVPGGAGQARRDADSISARSLKRDELLLLLSKGAQAKTVVLLDSCFSGKSSDGRELASGLQPLVAVYAQPQARDPRLVMMTAAKSDEFAGPLPDADDARPAFSYLILGALRGWAHEGRVTAREAVDYARRGVRSRPGGDPARVGVRAGLRRRWLSNIGRRPSGGAERASAGVSELGGGELGFSQRERGGVDGVQRGFQAGTIFLSFYLGVLE